MSTRPIALLRDLFAATPLAIFANAVHEILQSRAPSRLRSATVPAGSIPR